MRTQNIHFHDKIGKIPKISLNICFLELSDEISRGLKSEFKYATVNEPSVFELLRFYCSIIVNRFTY